MPKHEIFEQNSKTTRLWQSTVSKPLNLQYTIRYRWKDNVHIFNLLLPSSCPWIFNCQTWLHCSRLKKTVLVFPPGKKGRMSSILTSPWHCSRNFMACLMSCSFSTTYRANRSQIRLDLSISSSSSPGNPQGLATSAFNLSVSFCLRPSNSKLCKANYQNVQFSHPATWSCQTEHFDSLKLKA